MRVEPRAIQLGLLRFFRASTALLLVIGGWLFVLLPAVGFTLGTEPRPRLSSQPEIHPRSVLSKHGDIWHCHLAGSALQRGYACGRLTANMMAHHEAELFGTLESLVPFFPFRHLILGLVTLNSRSLYSFLEQDEIQAIAGVALGYVDSGDPNAHVGPAFGRILGYHALHDASQYLIDNPLINAPQVGCSAVAVKGRHSANGHVLVGRLFDFEGGRSFDLDKVVYTVEPDEDGLRYVHVAWGGVHGAVTGLNEAGLWLSANAGVSDQMAYQGRPLIVAIHRALATCSTIDEAIAHLTSQPVFVSESVLIATSRAAAGEPSAIALELAPRQHQVRVIADDHIILTNHFSHPNWAGDAANQARQADGTTAKRYARLEQLLISSPPHTPASVCEMLRDRRGLDDRDIGFGHRAGINAWIGAHLVVADLTEKVLWVAEPHHGLGQALAFDLDGPRPDIDPLPVSVDQPLFQRHGRTWKQRLENARHLVAARDPAAAANCQQLIDINPQHYDPYVLLARVVEDDARKVELLEQALERSPAYASEARAITRLLAPLRQGRQR